jgi:hypothetical protein
LAQGSICLASSPRGARAVEPPLRSKSAIIRLIDAGAAGRRQFRNRGNVRPRDGRACRHVGGGAQVRARSAGGESDAENGLGALSLERSGSGRCNLCAICNCFLRFSGTFWGCSIIVSLLAKRQPKSQLFSAF